MSDTDNAVLYRWDNHQDDRESYDLIFDEAIYLIAKGEKAVGALLMAVVNEWEKNRRNIPLPVVSAALTLAEETRAMRELEADLEGMARQPEDNLEGVATIDGWGSDEPSSS